MTGGAGFIGSALIKKVLSMPDNQVLNLDKLTYASSAATLEQFERHPGYSFVRADVADAKNVTKLLNGFRPEAVVHLAAESHVDRSIDSPLEFVETNVLGTAELLRAVQDYYSRNHSYLGGRFRLLHVSTDEVFGSLGESGLFDVNSPYRPRSPYAASKAASDHLVAAWHHTYGIPTIVSNSSNNYGPFQFPEKFIPLITIRGLLGLPMPVYGDGMNIRDWLHVEDHASALVRICQSGSPGATYLVGARNERRNIEIANKIAFILDDLAPTVGGRPHSALIDLTEDRPGHDFRYAVDPQSCEELGWEASIDFEHGLRATVEWYNENRWWWESWIGRSDAIDRLGLSWTGR